MVNLSFVTLKLKINPSRNQMGSYQGNSKAHNYTIEIKDITNDIRYGQFRFKTQFTILYLYDIFRDDESRNFIATSGWKLHNSSSANITIATYYSEDMVQKWSNVQHRDRLSIEGNDPNKVLLILDKIRNVYGIEKLPAMLIFKKDNERNDQFCIVELSRYKKENLYDIFRNVIDIINNHCEEDFSVIEQKISGPDHKITKSSKFVYKTFDYIEDLVTAESKHYQYTLDNLAEELDMTARTLYSRRTDRKFRRNELIYIAVRFGLTNQDLNMLLRENNHAEIGIDGRDGIILSALYQNLNIEEVHQQLLDNGYSSIKIEKKEKAMK